MIQVVTTAVFKLERELHLKFAPDKANVLSTSVQRVECFTNKLGSRYGQAAKQVRRLGYDHTLQPT